MKKSVLLFSAVICLSVFWGCGHKETTMKSKNIDVEFDLSEDDDWKVLEDNDDSYIISNDDEMISCSVVDIDENAAAKIPTTEKELLDTLGESAAAVSEISDFNYEVWNDSDTQILYYKQTITMNGTVTTIINRDIVADNQRKNLTATLVDADEDEIDKIANIIRSSR